jgi:hypothetical protein
MVKTRAHGTLLSRFTVSTYRLRSELAEVVIHVLVLRDTPFPPAVPLMKTMRASLPGESDSA